MKKNNIVAALNDLKRTDIYSAILFILYKLHDIPEYSSLSELAYILDKKSFIALLDFYGGTTIRIPTKQELTVILDTLLVYQYVTLENMTFEEALKQLNKTEYQVKDIKATYAKVAEVLQNYDFSRSK